MNATRRRGALVIAVVLIQVLLSSDRVTSEEYEDQLTTWQAIRSGMSHVINYALPPSSAIVTTADVAIVAVVVVSFFPSKPITDTDSVNDATTQ